VTWWNAASIQERALFVGRASAHFSGRQLVAFMSKPESLVVTAYKAFKAANVTVACQQSKAVAVQPKAAAA